MGGMAHMKRHRRHPQTPIAVPARNELRRAVNELPEDLGWDELRDGLRPVFVRRRPLPPGVEAPVMFRAALGLRVALGVDIGPAFLYVGSQLLASWPVSADAAFSLALDNLRESLVRERFAELEYAAVADMPIWWYQSQGGLASGLLLLEDELARRYGNEPRLLVAPMRNLLLAAPYDADRELLGWLRDEISLEDPNGLDLPIFELVEGRLSIDRRPSEEVRDLLVN
jgi:hypothetical protein